MLNTMLWITLPAMLVSRALCCFPLFWPGTKFVPPPPVYKNYENVIGIELGSTYSRIGIYRNGSFEIIPDLQGRNETPSCVAFAEGEILLGYEALYHMNTRSLNTICGFRDLLGRSYSDQNFWEDARRRLENIRDEERSPASKVKILDYPQRHMPEEAASIVLEYLKNIAQSYLKEPVTSAVLTASSHFDDEQRQALKNAAKMAGLNALRIMNESTAACRSHGLDRWLDLDCAADECLILVYDIGTQYSEVTLLTIDRGVFEHIMRAGDEAFGGKDLVEAFTETSSQINFEDQVALHVVYQGMNTPGTEPRSYTSSQAIVLKKPLALVEGVLRNAQVERNGIHGIVLTGALEHVTKIKSILESYFDGKRIFAGTRPDQAIVHGAAFEGAIISGSEGTSCDFDIYDYVTHLSVGIEAQGGVLVPVIHRHYYLPISRSQIFSTDNDNQTKMVFRIFEGERPMANDNRLLGILELEGIIRATKGVPRVEVSFTFDENRTLKIVARDENTGAQAELIHQCRGDGYDQETVNTIVQRAEAYREFDWAKEDAALLSWTTGTGAENEFAVVALEESEAQVTLS